MLEELRSKAYDVLMSPLGNQLAPVRWSKRALLYCNDLVGRPLATMGEFYERREHEIAQADLVENDSCGSRSSQVAPVFIYHKDNRREELKSIKDILDSAGISYTALNIEEDEATQAAVERDGKGHALPVVFIAGTAIGGSGRLLTLHKRGELAPLVFVFGSGDQPAT